MTVAEYKKLETRLAQVASLHLRRIRASILEAILRALKRGGQRFTVMIVPHSEKRLFNFQISFFSIIFFSFVVGLVLAGFALMAAHVGSANARLRRISQAFRESETTLEGFRDAVSEMRRAERGVKAGVENAQLALENQSPRAPIGGEVASLFPKAEAGPTNIAELADVKNAASVLESSAEKIRVIGSILKTYKELLADTPTLWPLRGVHGVITTRFGWTINPFTRLGYLHQGVDIAWGEGTPIVAAANGIVIQTGYNVELGNFVAIQHKYGFTTRYFHMMRITAHVGARVNRGDVIGYVGTTGLSTGPHVHYEVHLGTNYLDPMNFLSIPPDLDAPRPTGVASD